MLEREVAMDYNKIEDAVMKKAMDIFRESAVNFFGIDTKIIAPAETELKNIDISTSYIDYLFYTNDGNYLHFEFQTTDKKDDIKRFLYYDASLFYKEKRKIRTIVIYSSDIEYVQEYIDAGTIKYNFEPFYFKNIDGDEKQEKLKRKIYENKQLTSEDILTLTFLPLMKSKRSKSERAIECIELAEKIENSENKTNCISMLYALLEKFGDETSKIKFKEVFSMNEIGRMIRDEGIQEGIQKGIQEGIQKGLQEGIQKGEVQGKAEMLIILLAKKFKKIPNEYKDKIRNLPEDTINLIATDIFDIETIEELAKYF